MTTNLPNLNIKSNIDLIKWTNNAKLLDWIEQMVELCKPHQLHLCDGSHEESQQLFKEMTGSGACIKLNEKKYPNSYLFRSDPADVARIEESTFICSEIPEDAGPTNNWRDPKEMKIKLKKLFNGSMLGRTMYVLPFSMGPLNSKIAHIGVQITDSPYCVCNMRVMTRMGSEILKILKDGPFVPCMHSVGLPLKKEDQDVAWPCNTKNRYIVHFPKERSIWSYGSGYGGNALLGKKCFALRIASAIARDEGWLAEHMLILGITNPAGAKKYIAAAFPSACGKTNLAMLISSLPGWKFECVGDDICWMRFAKDGQLYAINPEAGFFGVAPGTSKSSNPNAIASLYQNAIYTNVAYSADGDVWWEGKTPKAPENLTDWLGNPWEANQGRHAAHPNARFTVPASQCPVIDPNWEDPKGVPISGIIFGGRRSSTIPLVSQAYNWQHGVFMGASVSSEMTAAAAGTLGKLRHDPFAMLPFCGYNMADYFQHWLSLAEKHDKKNLPKIFYVNWFRKNDEGKFIWPGFGENSRVIQWIYDRLDDKDNARETPIGYLPLPGTLDFKGLNLSEESLKSLFHIDTRNWLNEVSELQKYFSMYGEKLPKGIQEELENLKKRLKNP